MIGDPEIVILDVRSEEEFSGERFWPSGATEGAGRAGHFRAPYTCRSTWRGGQDGSLADGEELRRACEDLGMQPGQPGGRLLHDRESGERRRVRAAGATGIRRRSMCSGSWSES